MTISRRLVFGSPPFRYLAQHLAQDTDFLDDAKQILDLDEEAYLRLATQLSKADDFLSRTRLDSIAGEALGEGSDRIASIINQLGRMVHDSDMDSGEAMDALAEVLEEKVEIFEPEDLRTLVERLRKLVAEPVGIAKQSKARQLVDAIGAELDEFRIICDIRPIFDPKREQIDGAIPISMLRFDYTRPDGEPAVIELRVTEKQIEQFGEKISEANLKLRVIKNLLTSQEIPMPNTKSTIEKDKS